MKFGRALAKASGVSWKRGAVMRKTKNPYWGYWNIDWSDPREAADALGEGYYRGRWTQAATDAEELPAGFHIVSEEDEEDPWED